MKKIILPVCLLLATEMLYAQVPDDALRNSWYAPSGSARNLATGGVMGSLGGDITANHVNPAGLGLFKTREFVLTPGIALNNNKFDFRGSTTEVNKNAFNYGASGFIFGSPHRKGSKFVSSAFAISVNQIASFNNRVMYKGSNNTSSFSEQYLEELIRDRADTNAALSNYIFGSSLAFRTYLIDKEVNSGGVLTGYQSLVSLSTGILQENDITTRGGIHEISLGYATNLQDKLYLGGSVNIPVVYYAKDLKYRESDMTGVKNNDFNFFEFTENSTSRGVGVNAKLGLIYKPKDFIRLGAAFHTPSIISFSDNIRAAMTTDTEGYAGVNTETSDNLNSGNAGERNYNLLTPWKAIASASYVFREVKDTRKQRAFVSADLEYVNHSSSRFYASESGNSGAVSYYNTLNNTIKEIYKGALNFKVGAELKLHTWMFRAGGAYFGNPYKDNENLKANRWQATGGLGYRNYGMFIDLAYVHNFNKDVNFPYRLNDKPNTFANQSGSRGNVVATIGFKF